MNLTKGGSDPAFYYGLSFDEGNELCYILATQNPEELFRMFRH